MQADALYTRLAAFPAALRALLAPVTAADAVWSPSAEQWSIQAIVMHLADEDAADFPVRLRRTLDDPDQAWDPIDPEGWARTRDYHAGALTEALDRFTEGRAAALVSVRSVTAPDWHRAHTHPTIGPLSAGDLLAAWCAHDSLHLRQIAKRMFELTTRDAGTFSPRYAGEWTA